MTLKRPDSLVYNLDNNTFKQLPQGYAIFNEAKKCYVLIRQLCMYAIFLFVFFCCFFFIIVHEDAFTKAYLNIFFLFFLSVIIQYELGSLKEKV